MMLKDETLEKKLDELVDNYKNCEDEKKKRALHLEILELGMELVKKLAKPISLQVSTPIEDLVQIGAVGLIKSIDAYVPQKKVKFSTYANYFVRGEIRHYIRDKSALIKTPRTIQELFFKIYSASIDLTTSDGVPPSLSKISAYINVPEDKIKEVLDIEQYKYLVSLDQTVANENEDALLERIPSGDYQEFLSSYEDKIMIEEAINKLPEDLKEVLELSFYDELKQREIAERMNVSQMQISRKLKKALNYMYELIIRKKENE